MTSPTTPQAQDRATAIGNRRRKFVNFGRVVSEICVRTDRQTMIVTTLHTATRGQNNYGSDRNKLHRLTERDSRLSHYFTLLLGFGATFGPFSYFRPRFLIGVMKFRACLA